MSDAAPAVAKKAFLELDDIRASRIAQLRSVLQVGGIELDGSTRALQALVEFLTVGVRPDGNDPSTLDNVWQSLCEDIGLYLSEVLRERYPHLEWKLKAGGKRHVSFQHAVLAGFRNAVSTYTVDFARQVDSLGRSILEGKGFGPSYEPVLVRGHVVDVASIVENARTTEPPSPFTFVQWLDSAAEAA